MRLSVAIDDSKFSEAGIFPRLCWPVFSVVVFPDWYVVYSTEDQPLVVENKSESGSPDIGDSL